MRTGTKIAGALLGAALLLASPTVARGQRLTPPRLSSEPISSPLDQTTFYRDAIRFTSLESRRTYWLEGGIVGGVLLGLVGYSMGSACPANTGSCPSGVVGFGIGASVGFVLGAFIGDTIKKEPEGEQ